LATDRTPLWVVDWSDSEDDDFRAACEAAGVGARVLRGPALGTTVGTRFHKLRSWPTYLALAAAGLRRARGAPLICWQPLVGVVAASLRRGSRPPLVILNPLLDESAESRLDRIVLRGCRRADRVLFFSRSGLETGARLGLDPARLDFVPLGVCARRERPAPPGSYFLAAGREHRDWQTLAEAAAGLDVEVRVAGPTALPPGPLRLLPQVERSRFFELVDGALALVVPLLPGGRPAGQLALLDAMSVGRAVVATEAPGTVDYVQEGTGLLVPPQAPAALREALQRLADPAVAESMGAAALEAARGPFALERFVADVDRLARATKP
jgi:glycosyltransferase involved in cell wall biosynthesis